MSLSFASVILPVRRQSDHIGAVLEEYLEVFRQLDFPVEALPVVNGPDDDESLSICRSLERNNPSIRTLSIEQPGWGRAVRYGLQSAAGDLLCYANSARTAADDLARVLRLAFEHPDCVVKARRVIRENWQRRLGSFLYNLECRALFDLPGKDINATPKAFPRRFTPLMNLQENGDLIDLEFHALCRLFNYRVLEIPIARTSRRSGESTTGWSSAVHMYAGALRLRREWKKTRARGALEVL